MSAAETCLRQCSRCRKWKDEVDFYSKGTDRKDRRCKACILEIKKREYRKVKPYSFTVVRMENPDLGFLGRQLSKVVVNILKANDGQFKQKNWSNLQ